LDTELVRCPLENSAKHCEKRYTVKWGLRIASFLNETEFWCPQHSASHNW